MQLVLYYMHGQSQSFCISFWLFYIYRFLTTLYCSIGSALRTEIVLSIVKISTTAFNAQKVDISSQNLS